MSHDILRKGTDGIGIGDIQHNRGHAGVGVGDFAERFFPAAGHDDFVAESVKGFRQPAPDAGTAASDENGILMRFHENLCSHRQHCCQRKHAASRQKFVYDHSQMTALPRPYHHGNLRAALLRAAEDSLEEGGLRNVSLRELSRDLGVSHTSPRRHFSDKQALIDALALSGFERFDAALSRACGNHTHTFKARLTRLGRAYVAFALKHPALFALMFEAKHRPDPPRELLQASERAFGHGPATFAEGQVAGEVVAGDPGRLCLVLFATLQGLISISTNGKFKGVDLGTLTNEMIERIILGLRPRD